MKLMIDPGHGGSNPGCSSNGILEKEYTLDLCHLLLDAADRSLGIDCDMTRTDDATVKFSERKEKTNLFGADLLLSVHVNASENESARGSRLFVWPGSELAFKGAAAMCEALPSLLQTDHSASPIQVREEEYPRSYALLARFKQPTILFEVGFATNKVDSVLLKNRWMQLGLVSAMLSGVCAVAFKLESMSPQ